MLGTEIRFAKYPSQGLMVGTLYVVVIVRILNLQSEALLLFYVLPFDGSGLQALFNFLVC